jgi:ornithine carbamoyltransferase
MAPRHFLTLLDLSSEELAALLRRASALKRQHQAGERHQPFPGKILAMVFEKASTRTRVSFEAGMAHFGGHSIFLAPDNTQIGRGEPVEDTVRVLSRMADLIMVRTFAHATVERFASYSRVPIINGLTDLHHPCQLLADLQTYQEHRGEIAGRSVAWIGDGNNMCNSYIHAAQRCGFRLRVACPEGAEPDPDCLAQAAGRVEILRDPGAAVRGADLVVTDVWASMGQEHEAEERRRRFSPYQVDAALMATAAPDAIFMHCLPAHRGEEVTAEVLESAASVVWDEAENRLHAQKALMEFLLLQQAPPPPRG